MQKAFGTFKNTAATLYIGLGFKPLKIEVVNLTDGTAHLWAASMRIAAANAQKYGITVAAAGTRSTTASAAYGIDLYDGGDLMTAASTAYLVRAEDDKRAAYDGVTKITAWTLGSAANKTGNFNVEASTSFVGPGSKIVIDGIEYEIRAMTSNGEQANEVTLDKAAPSGAVSRITSMYEFAGAAKGVVIPKGFVIGASATVNDTGTDKCYFEAEGQ